MKLYTSLCLFFLLLAGCDTGPNLAKMCEQHQEICNEFNEDSWCKRERIAVGFKNVALKENASDLNKYHLLVAYENYAACMNHASKIEHIKLKEKRTLRIDNYMKAKGKIEALSKETVTSEHPELLYYHWTRHLNKEALAKFLKMEGSGVLETPSSQFNLATYYAKRDPNKTLSLLFHALELYRPNEEVNTEIFKSISTIFEDKKEYKQAYIWLKVLQLHTPDDETINDKTLKKYIKVFALDAPFLNKVAESTLDKIESGTFKSPRY